VGTGTVFRACSITKQVTALGVLCLVGQGRLDLDADVRHWLRDEHRVPAVDAGPVTLRQLLGHTSGLAGPDLVDRSEGAPTLAELVTDRRPVRDFHYASANYSVIQRVLTDSTGEEFAPLLRSLVLDPLGLRESGFEPSFADGRSPDVAYGHLADGTPRPRRWWHFPELAAGGLWTTPADLGRVAGEIHRAATGRGGVVLNQRLAREMVEPPPGGGYGLGTVAKVRDGRHWIAHPGDLDTYQCFSAMDLERGDGLVVMANAGVSAEFLPDLLADIDFPIPPAL
jgi:CubicO group peptidase (beta-lactamase class C family)